MSLAARIEDQTFKVNKIFVDFLEGYKSLKSSSRGIICSGSVRVVLPGRLFSTGRSRFVLLWCSSTPGAARAAGPCAPASPALAASTAAFKASKFGKILSPQGEIFSAEKRGVSGLLSYKHLIIIIILFNPNLVCLLHLNH